MNYKVDEKNTLYADLAPEEGVLLNLKTKYYFRLNETSQLIWKGLQEGKSQDAIAAEIQEAYDADEREILEDVLTLTLKLQDEGFLLSDETTPTYSVSAAQKSKSTP